MTSVTNVSVNQIVSLTRQDSWVTLILKMMGIPVTTKYKITCKACKHVMTSGEWLAQENYCTNEKCEMSRKKRRSRRQQSVQEKAKKVVNHKSTIKIPPEWEVDVTDSLHVFYKFKGDLRVVLAEGVTNPYPQGLGEYHPRPNPAL